MLTLSFYGLSRAVKVDNLQFKINWLHKVFFLFRSPRRIEFGSHFGAQTQTDLCLGAIRVESAGTWLNEGLKEKFVTRLKVLRNSTLQIAFWKRRQEQYRSGFLKSDTLPFSLLNSWDVTSELYAVRKQRGQVINFILCTLSTNITIEKSTPIECKSNIDILLFRVSEFTPIEFKDNTLKCWTKCVVLVVLADQFA